MDQRRWTTTGGRLVCLLVAMQLSALQFGLLVWAAAPPAVETGDGDPPRIMGRIDPIKIAKEGDRLLKLHCPVEGRPAPIIRWKKDGESVGAHWLRFRLTNGDKTLRVKHLETEDTGEYVCEAVNGFGKREVVYDVRVYDKDGKLPDVRKDMDSDYHDDTAEGKAPSWRDPLTMENAQKGKIIKASGTSLKLDCSAVGYPIPEIEWSRNGQRISVYDPLRQKSLWKLDFDKLTPQDSGKYRCRVKNVNGLIEANFDVKVTGEPSIERTNRFMNTTVREGQVATFECKVRTSGTSKEKETTHIQWVKLVGGGDEAEALGKKVFKVEIQGKTMDIVVLDKFPSETVAHPNNTLVNRLEIPRVTQADAGVYICVVTDAAGNMVYKKAHLKVDTESIPVLLLIGICAAVFLLLLLCYAIYFVQKNRRKPALKCAGAVDRSANQRPPPPSRPPPSLPNSYVASPLPHCNAPLLAAGGPYQVPLPPPGSSPSCLYSQQHYHQLEWADRRAQLFYATSPAAAEAPLRGGPVPTTRPKYGRAPDSTEVDYDGDYPNGRLQPFPSMYSCA